VHVVLLRRVIGDALRARRQGQQRTLREVSTAANVSLGYLSEIERGQKEASSELLAAICDALGAQLSDLLREVSDTVALAEQLPDVLVPAGEQPVRRAEPARAAPTSPAASRPIPTPAAEQSASEPAEPVTADAVAAASARIPAAAGHAMQAGSGGSAAPSLPVPAAAAGPAKAVRTIATDGKVSVSIRQDSPLKATLHAWPLRAADRDVVPVG
jgi:transcriptional regulator with XRE-family HTH domain